MVLSNYKHRNADYAQYDLKVILWGKKDKETISEIEEINDNKSL